MKFIQVLKNIKFISSSFSLGSLSIEFVIEKINNNLRKISNPSSLIFLSKYNLPKISNILFNKSSNIIIFFFESLFALIIRYCLNIL